MNVTRNSQPNQLVLETIEEISQKLRVYTDSFTTSIKSDLSMVLKQIKIKEPADSLCQLVNYLFNTNSPCEEGMLSYLRKQSLIILATKLRNAVQYQSNGIHELLAVINNLQPDQKYFVLSQCSKQGFNALMLAAQVNPVAITDLLASIDNLQDIQRYDILAQLTVDDWNILMIAARYQQSIISKLLKSVLSLDSEQKQNILEQVNNANENALMIAARYDYKAVTALIEAIKHLEPYRKLKILMQLGKDGYSAATLAASYQPMSKRIIQQTMDGLIN